MSSSTVTVNVNYRLTVLFLVSHFNFLFVPCGGLSWLPVSFLLHAKYTRIVSYHIVDLAKYEYGNGVQYSWDDGRENETSSGRRRDAVVNRNDDAVDDDCHHGHAHQTHLPHTNTHTYTQSDDNNCAPVYR